MELPVDIPEHEFNGYYAPTFRLEVPRATLDNLNTLGSLSDTRAAALQTVSQMPERTVVMKLPSMSGPALPRACMGRRRR